MPASCPTVAVDVTPLLGRRTGVGVSVAAVLAAVTARPAPPDLVGYGLTLRGWRHLRRALPAGVRPARPLPLPASASMRLWKAVALPPAEWWTGPLDVVHGTNFVVPPTRRAARLMTVHDLTAVRFPQMCTPAALMYPELVRSALDGGAHVHTFSRSVADEVIEHFGADPLRVHVVAPAVTYAPAPPTKVNGGPPYVLGLGTAEPRKNFPALIRAFDEVASVHPDLRLVLAGPAGWGEAALRDAISACRHRQRVDRVGWVDDPAGLVAGAAVFAYPSLYEGFGFPPLEAMAAGVPVVAGAAGALPEVLGDAAVLVDPSDVGALSAAIDQVLCDEEIRRMLIARGRHRAASFPPEECGAGFDGLYRRLSCSGG